MKIATFTTGPLMTNCYIVSDSGEAVLIDAADYDKDIISYLNDNELTLKMILLTHAHFDHILGAASLADDFHAPVVVGKLDEPALYDATLNGSVFFGIQSYKTVDSCITISEGDKIQVGDTVLSVIESPGHTIGGVAYYTPGHLFSGDTLFEESIGRTDLMNGNFETLIATIKDKYYKLPDDTVVYPGHGNITTIGHEKKNNFYAFEK